jgi:hypothetical protein
MTSEIPQAEVRLYPPYSSKPEVSNQFHVLWIQAVEEYETKARLNPKQTAILRQANNPEEAFDLAKHGWETKIGNKQWKHHETTGRTVSQVLGMFDVVGGILGLASVVLILCREPC